jgi:predicted amidohydrolase YtcJ
VNDLGLDAIYLADTIHTLAGAAIDAIGVREGIIRATGSRADAAGWGPARTVTDFGPATLTPGLIDAHSHAVSAASGPRGVDLSSCRSLREVVVALADTAAAHEGWLLGWSLDPNLFAGNSIDNAFLIGLPDRPVYLRLADGHSAIANSRALYLAGVTGPREFGSRAEVVCDAAGAPTGLLLEAATGLVRQHVPPLGFADEVAAVRSTLDAMAATGLTALSLLDFDDESVEVLKQLEAEAPLPLRLRCSPVFDPGAEPIAELERVLGLLHHRGERWAVEGVKFVLDGTVENGTAWLESPDTDGESTESLWRTPGRYRAALTELARRGVPTATHAIGDAAIRYAVATIAALSPEAKARAPHRIEHVETMPTETLREFADSGAIASMQPTHSTLYVWGNHADEWSRRLGPERSEHNGFRLRDLVRAGVTVALGSDWPVAPFDPRQIIADAQSRRPYNRPDAPPVFPHQSLSAGDALRGYTSSAAIALGWQKMVGTIEVGKCADFTVFELDPLTAHPDDFAVAPVVGTVLDGALVRVV